MKEALQRARAAAFATGQYLGWDGPHFRGQFKTEGTQWTEICKSLTYPFAARFGVLRAGWVDYCYKIVLWEEFAQYDEKGELLDSWHRRPCHYLGLCAELVALQSAFPEAMQAARTIERVKPNPLKKPLKTASNEDLEEVLIELGYESEHQRLAVIANARKKFPLLAGNNPGAFNAKMIAEAKPARKAVPS